MKVYAVEGCFDKWTDDQVPYPVNWEHIGTVYLEDEMPRFIMIGDVKYEAM